MILLYRGGMIDATRRSNRRSRWTQCTSNGHNPPPWFSSSCRCLRSPSDRRRTARSGAARRHLRLLSKRTHVSLSKPPSTTSPKSSAMPSRILLPDARIGSSTASRRPTGCCVRDRSRRRGSARENRAAASMRRTAAPSGARMWLTATASQPRWSTPRTASTSKPVPAGTPHNATTKGAFSAASARCAIQEQTRDASRY